MAREVEKTVLGYCPKQETECTVRATYAEVLMAGGTAPGCKLLGLRCEYAQKNGCDIAYKCPVAKSSCP